MSIYNITRLFTIQQRKAIAFFLDLDIRDVKIYYSDWYNSVGVSSNKNYYKSDKTKRRYDIVRRYAYDKIKNVPISERLIVHKRMRNNKKEINLWLRL